MYVTIPTDNAAAIPVSRFSDTRQKSFETHIKAGSYLYFEGDDVKWLYLVTKGVLRLTRLLEDGRRQVIAFGYPGDVVGFPADGLHHTDCDVLVDADLQPFSLGCLEGTCAHQEIAPPASTGRLARNKRHAGSLHDAGPEIRGRKSGLFPLRAD